MAYTKQNWKDATGTKLNRYNDQNGTIYEFEWNPETVTEGTPVTAARMNHMEDGIKAADDAIGTVAESAMPKAGGNFTGAVNAATSARNSGTADKTGTMYNVSVRDAEQTAEVQTAYIIGVRK